jgi:hypothetical protein
MSIKVIKFLVFAAILVSLESTAQELSPRVYWPTPVDTQVLTVGYSYMAGDVIPDRSLPLTGVDSDINTIYLGYRRTLNLWGRTANITLEAPYIDGTTVGTREGELNLEREYSGVGDVAATLSVNILGAATMDKQEFRQMLGSFRHLFGVSVKLVAPTGKYDSKRLINVGANRWAMRAEVGYIAVLKSKWILETSLGVWFFEDNDNFLGVSKQQKPVMTLQAHLIHRFRPGLWASLDMNYYQGGRSTIGGRRLDDLQRDSKIGATLVFPFATRHAIKLGYTKGSINDSDESFDVFLASYQRLF